MIVTFSRTFPDQRHIINKNGHVLKVEPKLKKEIFNSPPIVAFKSNKNLRDFIGGNKLYNNKKQIHAKIFDKEKCHSCLTRTINLYVASK